MIKIKGPKPYKTQKLVLKLKDRSLIIQKLVLQLAT